jgi:YHS domain-containing protein
MKIEAAIERPHSNRETSMRKTFRTLAAATAVVIAAGSAALAGPQYVDDNNFAASGFDVLAYFDKEQAPVGQPQPAPTPGRSDITAEHNGAVFAFASEENRARFLAEPAAYAPQFDGHCAFGVAKGGKVPGDPQLWRIVDGKLYLNLQKSVAEMWEADIAGYLETAATNWPDLDPTPASDRAVPELTPGSAPKTN